MQKKDVKATEKVVEKVETVKEVAKDAAKDVAKKAETVKKTAAKTAAKTTTTAKKTVKKAASTAAAKATASKSQIIVQYQNNEIETDKIEERVKAQFISEGHKASTIKKVNIYIKPEEYSAYYVINDKFSGRVDLF